MVGFVVRGNRKVHLVNWGTLSLWEYGVVAWVKGNLLSKQWWVFWEEIEELSKEALSGKICKQERGGTNWVARVGRRGKIFGRQYPRRQIKNYEICSHRELVFWLVMGQH